MQKCWGKSKGLRMKKALSFLKCVLFGLTILYPAGVILTACWGYTFELFSMPAFAIAIAVFSVGVVVLDIFFADSIQSKIISALMALITPLSLINTVFCFFKCSQVWVFVGSMVYVGCCFYLGIKHGKPIALKIVALVLSVMMMLPIGFWSFIALAVGDFGQNTVVQSVESPNGRYYAQVIDSDQGALGGDTLVNVYRKSGVNLLLFKIEKKPQRVYLGEWGAYKNMDIYWKDDSCLVINSIEYEIE